MVNIHKKWVIPVQVEPFSRPLPSNTRRSPLTTCFGSAGQGLSFSQLNSYASKPPFSADSSPIPAGTQTTHRARRKGLTTGHSPPLPGGETQRREDWYNNSSIYQTNHTCSSSARQKQTDVDWQPLWGISKYTGRWNSATGGGAQYEKNLCGSVTLSNKGRCIPNA